MEYSALVSLLFFSVFSVYLFFTFYVISENYRAPLNQAFFVMGISLSIWSFCFGMANSAPDIAASLFWRKIAVICWSTTLNILLHALLILTGKTKVLKKWWFYLVLYIPSAFSIYAFTFSKEISDSYFNLTRENIGWVNIWTNNIWHIVFYVVSAGYILACLAIIWHWKKKSTDKNIRKQATMIFLPILGSVLLYSILNILFKDFFSQMAPVFYMIPISFLFYHIRKFTDSRKETFNKYELFLGDGSRIKLFEYFAIALILIGLRRFTFEFIQSDFIVGSKTQYAMMADGMMILLGISLCAVQKLKNDEKRYIVSILLAFVSIPITTLRYIHTAGITAWVFPIILIIISLVLGRRLYLIVITLLTVVMQVVIWKFTSADTIALSEFDLKLRIGFFILILVIGWYINKIFISKYYENSRQIAFHKLISETTYDFINIDKANFDERVSLLLQKSCRFFDMDRAYMLLFNQKNQSSVRILHWCREGIDLNLNEFGKLSNDILLRMISRFDKQNVRCVEDVSMLPESDQILKSHLIGKKIKSFIIMPIEAKETIYGFFCFDSISTLKKWDNEHIKMMKTYSNLISNAITKIEAENEIEFMAFYDPLTSIPNRRFFTGKVKQAIEYAKETDKKIMIMFIDLDGFKVINDTMGHNVGDIVIKEVANTISDNLRVNDMVARIGGDEFLIMINDIKDDKDITEIPDSIIKLFKKPFHINDREFYITASAGVSVYPFDGEDEECLIKNADVAMYKAKIKGKNQYLICTQEMKDELYRDTYISNSLYHAIEQNEFSVYYQPQIDAQTGQIVGMEALLRWMHPKLGIIPPSIFIPLAEKNGLISNIGDWVLETTCRQYKEWQNMGLNPMKIAINISIVQFRNPNFIDLVQKLLEQTEIEADSLELEITESVALSEANYVGKMLEKLKALGVSISIDDFGSQYSTLSRLKDLPIDKLKIDMQFVKGLDSNEKDQAICKIIVTLAKSLSLRVIAEGVEKVSQLEFLRNIACDEVQGYYYYKPMPAEEAEKLLRKQSMTAAGLVCYR